MMARPGIPIYVLGQTMKEIRMVTSVLVADKGGINEVLNDVWTVHRNVKLRKEYTTRAVTVDNKGYSDRPCMDRTACCREFTSLTCTPQQTESQHMECLKSVSDISNSALNDNGYASGDETDKQISEDCGIETDIHEIALLTKPKTELPSLILHRFIHAGIFVLAVDTEQFDKNMELYEKTLRELGTYSVLTKAGYTELIVVNTGEQSNQNKIPNFISSADVAISRDPIHLHKDACGFKKNARKLFNAIRKSYFGCHFGTCCITELGQKICEIVSKYEMERAWPTGRFTNQRSMIQTLERKGTFTEMGKADISESTLEQSGMFYFQVIDTGYICCRPDKLVQKYISLLEMLEMRGALAPNVSVDDFTLDIDYEETNIMLSALVEAKLIEEEDEDTVHLLPLITQVLLPQYDEKRTFKIETNVLRLAIDISIVPTVLMVNIIMRCVHFGWVVRSKAPKACESRDSVLLEKGSFGVVMTFDSAENVSNVGLCIIRFQTDENGDAKFDCGECEKLRNAVESEVESCTSVHNHKLESVTVCGQYMRSKDEKDLLRMKEGQWTDVTKLMSCSDNELGISEASLLKHWYPAKCKELEETMNKSMRDDVLVKIAELFGRGYKIFFIGQKIPSSFVDRIGLENQNNVTYTVFQLLKEWVRINGYKANFSLLRTAITESSINIDLSKFDEIVKESQ